MNTQLNILDGLVTLHIFLTKIFFRIIKIGQKDNLKFYLYRNLRHKKRKNGKRRVVEDKRSKPFLRGAKSQFLYKIKELFNEFSIYTRVH